MPSRDPFLMFMQFVDKNRQRAHVMVRPLYKVRDPKPREIFHRGYMKYLKTIQFFYLKRELISLIVMNFVKSLD
jgi:hypothetical protein